MKSVRFKPDPDLDNLYNQVVPSGFEGKFNEATLMGIQVLEAIYYALEVYFLTQGANAFYAYPVSSESDNYRIPLESIITDEDSFVCNGTTYFRNATGPLADHTFASSTSDLDMVRGLPQYFFIAIFAVVAFTFTRIYMGKYNMLLKLVKFKKDQYGVPKPFEFGIFFTIACNAWRWVKLSFVDVCGRKAFFSEDLSPDDAQYAMLLIYTIVVLLLILWLMLWLVSCGLLTFCNGRKQFKWLRRLILVASVVTTAIWAINFDPKFDFDIKMPRIFAVNVVSFFDLGTSILGEIYLSFPGPFQACCCSDEVFDEAGNFQDGTDEGGAVDEDDVEADEMFEEAGNFKGETDEGVAVDEDELEEYESGDNSEKYGYELNSLDDSNDHTIVDNLSSDTCVSAESSCSGELAGDGLDEDV